MVFLKEVHGLIKNIVGDYTGTSTIKKFFREVREYKSALDQSYINVLGKERANKVSEFKDNLLTPDSYLFKTENLSRYTAYGFSQKEGFLFYVAVSLFKEDEFNVDCTGKISCSPRVLRTSPFFFFDRRKVMKRAEESGNISFPIYLGLWIHEYSHFIGYCLQKKPIAVATIILYDQLTNESYESVAIEDLSKFIQSKHDEGLAEIAKTIVYLQSLDEDMANFLQELILQDLGFDTGTYFAELMRKSLFYPYFRKWGKERFVEYIEDWNNANFRAPQFMKTFLKSLNKIEVERHPRVSQTDLAL